MKERMSPEEALKICEGSRRGRLKVLLGYAAGVGKTYKMLAEANKQLMLKSEDIYIGYLEPHDRPETINQVGELETIQPKEIEYSGRIFKEVDVEAIIEIKPHTVLIDELAHTNVPGSRNAKRYMDVEEILNAGINVITTMNVQHLESLNDVVEKITGIKVRETIPDWVVNEADEIVVVDITTDELIGRLKRGEIYKKHVILRALKNFFRRGNLNALREITLRQVADEVNIDLEDYKKDHNIEENWFSQERILVSISTNPNSKMLIRRGARMADRYKCEWYVVFVECTHFTEPKVTYERRKDLDENTQLAYDLGAKLIYLKGKSVSEELLTFARKERITQFVLGHSNRSGIQKIFRGSTLNKLLKDAKDLELHIIPYK